MTAKTHIQAQRRRRAGQRAISHRLENLEPRVLLTTLYWAANGPYATGVEDHTQVVDLTGANWTTDPSGTGPLVSWSPGDKVVFKDVTIGHGSYTLPAGTRWSVSGNLSLSYDGVGRRPLVAFEEGTSVTWTAGNFSISQGWADNLGTFTWNADTLSLTNSSYFSLGGVAVFNKGSVNVATVGGALAITTSACTFNRTTLTIGDDLYIYSSATFKQCDMHVLYSGWMYIEGQVNSFSTDLLLDGHFTNDGTLNWRQGQFTATSGSLFENSRWGVYGDDGTLFFYPGTIHIYSGNFSFQAGASFDNGTASVDGLSFHEPSLIFANPHSLSFDPEAIILNPGLIDWGMMPQAASNVRGKFSATRWRESLFAAKAGKLPSKHKLEKLVAATVPAGG